MVETKEYKRQYYLNNKEHILKVRAEYRAKNKDIINKKNNEWYYKNQGKQLIRKWENAGFRHSKDFFDSLTKKYIDATNCELCDVKFTDKGNNKKVCDHHHSSGSFRNICCHQCNMKRLKVDNQHIRVMMELHRVFLLK